VFFPKFNRLAAVTGFGHHVHIFLLFDDCNQAVTNDRMIVGD
jgi:hypothetical protein